MKRRLVWILAAVLLHGVATVTAQSLTEVAKKEQERRKRIEARPAPTYTNHDLRGLSGTLPSALPTEPDESQLAEEEIGSTEDAGEGEEDPTRTEAYWRGRLAAIDQRIADIEGRLNRPGFDQDPRNMLRRIRLERELAEARSERRALTDEARRKGVPPGWLR
ncbi:MAG: hypothetical protein ACE5JI_01750 [Acidobacteriota bacterium]